MAWTKAISAYIVLISFTLGLESTNASCWTSFIGASLLHWPVDHVYSSIQEFCAPGRPLTVTSDEPLARNWTIGSSTLEITAEIDSPNACQDVTLSINPVDTLCEKYLAQIANQCDIQHIQSGFRGFLLVDGCQVWSLVSYASHSLKKIVSRDLEPGEFHSYAEKGLGNMKQLQKRLENTHIEDVPELSDDQMDREYTTTWKEKTSSSLDAVSLHRSGIRTTVGFYEAKSVFQKESLIYYRNFLDPKGGMIIAMDNKGRYTDSATGQTIVASRRWSTMAWHFWVRACQKAGVEADTLKGIVRHWVINGQTVDVMREVAAKKRIDFSKAAKKGKPTPVMTFSRQKNPEAFYAIVRTPNGRGVVWLLMERSRLLGKTLKDISAFAIYLGTETYPLWVWEITFNLKKYNPKQDGELEELGEDAEDDGSGSCIIH